MKSFCIFALLAFAAGCAPATSAVKPATAADTKPAIEVAPMVVSPFSDAELARNFEKGRSLLLADKPDEAAPIFDSLLRLAPDGVTAAPSLFNGAIAHEAMGDREGACDRIAALLTKFPDYELVREATFRAARLDAYLERWKELDANAARLLAITDLTVIEAIEANGFKALARVELDDVDGAEKAVHAARDLIETNRIGEATKPPLAIAEVEFALGEVRRKKSERIVFVPVPASFGDALEARCTGLLDAQSAYTDAMKAMDAHWSAMAGYRVGQLYQQLHRDVMQAPAPPNAKTLKQKQLWEGAMRLRYRVLLEKGLKMMEATARIGDRTGEDSSWVHRARDAKKDLELSLEDEKQAMAKLPFTEAELQAALDSLKAPAVTKKP